MRRPQEEPSLIAIALSFLVLLVIIAVAFRWTRRWWRFYASLTK